MRLLLSIGSVVAALLAPGAASASTFDFSYRLSSSSFSGFSVAASGVLTTADAVAADGSVQITGISGSRTFVIGNTSSTQTIGGLSEPDLNYQADFKLFPNQAVKLDSFGFTFTVDGGRDVNLSYYNGRYLEPIELPFDQASFTLTPTGVSAVPLPASAPMFGVSLAALGLLGGFMRRGRRATAKG